MKSEIFVTIILLIQRLQQHFYNSLGHFSTIYQSGLLTNMPSWTKIFRNISDYFKVIATAVDQRLSFFRAVITRKMRQGLVDFVDFLKKSWKIEKYDKVSYDKLLSTTVLNLKYQLFKFIITGNISLTAISKIILINFNVRCENFNWLNGRSLNISIQRLQRSWAQSVLILCLHLNVEFIEYHWTSLKYWFINN